MARIATIPARDGVLGLVREDAAVLAILDASSVYDQQQPAKAPWPFVFWGAPSGTALRATGLDGQTLRPSLHVFSKGAMEGDKLVERAEDHCDRLAAAVARAVDRRRIMIPGGRAKIRVTDTIGPMQDSAVAGAFHVVINLSVRCLTA